MISGYTASNDRARERAVGVRETLETHGLKLPAKLLIETDFTIHSAREALGKALAQDPKVTAVVCGNDILAIGALMEAAARDIPVPGALSVTGFDDIELAHEWNPGITTVRLPYSQIGARAAERMLLRLDGKATPKVEEIPVQLVARSSSGPAPKLSRREAKGSKVRSFSATLER
jgi:LacI family transcriptional regulator